jgi:hypothetical protein
METLFAIALVIAPLAMFLLVVTLIVSVLEHTK